MVISRFAPSPTGDLHIGSIRTALYAWIFARQQKGKFILRIEDTDRERSTQESIDAILNGMQWLGLDYDEGPIHQMERLTRYEEVAKQLLDSGHAYKCYCSKERLEQLRTEQMANNEKPKYDGYCRYHNVTAKDNQGLSFVIRFATPQSGEVHFDDRIRGELKVSNSELDDVVLVRSDGIPTYNYAVVIDDHDMGVSMVIRGDDHINNTYRQINIFKALNAKPPQYAHVPSILGSDGKRLSKRHGATSVLAYRDQGILPQALINALLRLGWAHGDQEIFSHEEMLQLFKIDDVHKSPAVFDQQKLLWFNQHYLKTLPAEIIVSHLVKFLDNQGINYKTGQNKPELVKVVAVLQPRCKTLLEMAEKTACFYMDKVEYNPEAVAKFFNEATVNILQDVITACNNITNWNIDNLHEMVQQLMHNLNLKMPQLAQPIRIALTGDTNSPSINETMALMPKQEVIERLEAAIEYCVLPRSNSM
jgi:glutamyl-tRNA synthetase